VPALREGPRAGCVLVRRIDPEAAIMTGITPAVHPEPPPPLGEVFAT
jgi:hypothetical protein